MKKLITIVLLLVMLVSILVLPTMASEIHPRYPIGYCRYCGLEATYRGVTTSGGVSYYQYYCSDCGMWTYVAK